MGWFPSAAVGGVAMALLGGIGCGVKRTVNVPVPAKVLEAKTATLDELITLIGEQGEGIQSLSSNDIRITLTSGKVESGELQQYRSAPGYILLKRPDLIRLSVQNPVTKTAIVELLSVGDQFSIWYPRENKFYVGANSAKELEIEGDPGGSTFAARPIHISQAILLPDLPLGDPGVRISQKEDQDESAKYYILSLFREAGDFRLRPLSELWVERSVLGLVKKITFEEDGAVASMVHYSNLISLEGYLVPQSIRIERPLDDYSLDMEFKTWRINPDLPDSAFVLRMPPGAERVVLKEKIRRGVH
jgi:hypothetical protein